MPRIAAVVLLFHPSEEVLLNIESYRKEVDHLYIIDNTEISLSTTFIKEKVLSFSNTSLLHEGENYGIAKALNLALKHAKDDGYEWLLTMDQDSFFDKVELLNYLEHFNGYKYENAALIAPLHNPKFVNISLIYPYVKKEAVLSSGNLVNVKSALDAGAYDEALFIDDVDHAFCFELKRHNYVILQDQTIFLNHKLGRAFGKYGNIKLYPSIRLYYMLRNYLYLKDKYASEFSTFFQQRGRYLVKFFMKQLLFGKNRTRNIKMMTQGYLDHKNAIYGKYYGK